MRLIMRNYIAIMILSLGGLSSSLADSSAPIPQSETSLVSSFSVNSPILGTASNKVPAYLNYLQDDNDAVQGDRFPVSTVADVDIWTLLAVIFGLIALQLWNRGDRRLHVIN